jgi:anti-sigma regulatory factor (Ser/Thr protein kinase)
MKTTTIDRFSELPVARVRVIGELRLVADDASDFQAAQLIVAELLSNALRYGGAGVSYAFEWDGDDAVLHVWDRGPAFSLPLEQPPVTAAGGRGLRIVKTLSRGLYVDRTPHGNHVRCILPVSRQPVD